MSLKTWWRDVRLSMMKKAATVAARRVADKALDDLETAVLGDDVDAEQILRAQKDIDPLTRIRAAHGITSEHKEASIKTNDAQAELARLKEKHTEN